MTPQILCPAVRQFNVPILHSQKFNCFVKYRVQETINMKKLISVSVAMFHSHIHCRDELPIVQNLFLKILDFFSQRRFYRLCFEKSTLTIFHLTHSSAKTINCDSVQRGFIIVPNIFLLERSQRRI